jgi:hypothetical protein
MKRNEYIVAIPSYKRVNTLKNKTLRVLKESGIDPKKIYVFVADEEQKKLYRDALDRDYQPKLIVGEPGIRNIRNFMANYFPEKQRIFYIDDDISHIYQNFNTIDPSDKKHNKLSPMKDLNRFILKAFDEAQKRKMDNWGVYPVENPYFMKPTTRNVNDYTSTNLVYIIGFMTGVVNNKEAEIRTIDDKEDYERSIKYYLKDNGVLRFNNITCRTQCYKEPGGMQVERTKQRIHDSAVYLTKEYPELCTLNTSKKSGYTEIRLRDRRIGETNPTKTKTKPKKKTKKLKRK